MLYFTNCIWSQVTDVWSDWLLKKSATKDTLTVCFPMCTLPQHYYHLNRVVNKITQIVHKLVLYSLFPNIRRVIFNDINQLWFQNIVKYPNSSSELIQMKRQFSLISAWQITIEYWLLGQVIQGSKTEYQIHFSEWKQ